MSKIHEEYKKLNLCVRCGDKRFNGHIRCEKCHLKHLKYNERSKEKAIKNGKCRVCLIENREENNSMCALCLKKSRDRMNATYSEIRLKCIKNFGGFCVCCGESNQKYLQLDHIHNNGAEHKKNLKENNEFYGSFYKWAVKNNYPKDVLQLLCANCHSAKSWHGGCTIKDHLPLEKNNMGERVERLERVIDMLLEELIPDEEVRDVVADLLKSEPRKPTQKEIEYGKSLSGIASRCLDRFRDQELNDEDDKDRNPYDYLKE